MFGCFSNEGFRKETCDPCPTRFECIWASKWKARALAAEAVLEAGHRLAPYLSLLLDPEGDAAKVRYTSPQVKALIRAFLDALTAHKADVWQRLDEQADGDRNGGEAS